MSVKVYALTTCPYCRMTRTYLDEQGVAYDVTEVDKLEGQERGGRHRRGAAASPAARRSRWYSSTTR